MAAKPTEIKKLVALLEQDYDSAEDCAKAIFKAIEEMIWTREHYVLVVQRYDTIKQNTYLLQAIGPYATTDKATKDINKKITGVGGSIVTQCRTALLRHPDQVSV